MLGGVAVLTCVAQALSGAEVVGQASASGAEAVADVLLRELGITTTAGSSPAPMDGSGLASLQSAITGRTALAHAVRGLLSMWPIRESCDSSQQPTERCGDRVWLWSVFGASEPADLLRSAERIATVLAYWIDNLQELVLEAVPTVLPLPDGSMVLPQRDAAELRRFRACPWRPWRVVPSSRRESRHSRRRTRPVRPFQRPRRAPHLGHASHQPRPPAAPSPIRDAALSCGGSRVLPLGGVSPASPRHDAPLPGRPASPQHLSRAARTGHGPLRPDLDREGVQAVPHLRDLGPRLRPHPLGAEVVGALGGDAHRVFEREGGLEPHHEDEAGVRHGAAPA